MIMQNWSKKLFGIIVPFEQVEAEQIRFDTIIKSLRIDNGSFRTNHRNLHIDQAGRIAGGRGWPGGAPPGVS